MDAHEKKAILEKEETFDRVKTIGDECHTRVYQRHAKVKGDIHLSHIRTVFLRLGVELNKLHFII